MVVNLFLLLIYPLLFLFTGGGRQKPCDIENCASENSGTFEQLDHLDHPLVATGPDSSGRSLCQFYHFAGCLDKPGSFLLIQYRDTMFIQVTRSFIGTE
jgi:hypothetical protein